MLAPVAFALRPGFFLTVLLAGGGGAGAGTGFSWFFMIGVGGGGGDVSLVSSARPVSAPAATSQRPERSESARQSASESAAPATSSSAAVENVAAAVSVARLNRLLREAASKAGQPWTRDVVPFAKHTVPVYLSPAAEYQMQPWVERFDADHGKDLAVEVREYFIPDFSAWKDNDPFEAAFTRLLRDLKAEGPPSAK